MKRFLLVSLALLGVMAATPSAHANALAPGGSNTVADTFSIAGNGLTLVDTWAASPAALSAPGGGVTQTIFGTYQEWVYKDASGNLYFLEQVANSALSTASVARITASSYGSFTTDVGYLTGALPSTGGAVSGGITPNAIGGGVVIDRSDEGSGVGQTVGFYFGATKIIKGSNSVVLVIQTNAKAYDRLGTLSVIDGTTSSNLTFEPTVVPEPSTMAIAGLGALGLIGYGLRRRKALGA